MEDNLHDVVKLLLARMKSHPEEFRRDHRNAGRWYDVMDVVRDYGTKEEDDAIDAGLRPIRLQEAHEMMMDDLLNGDERRRKEMEEHEYERQMMAQHTMRISANGSVGIGTTTPSTTLAVTTVNENMYGQAVNARYPTHADMEKNSLINALRNMK